MGIQADMFATLLAEHGRYVTRKPHPTGELVPNIRAMWMEDLVERRANDEGERTERRGRLQTLESASYEETDHWVVLGEEWIQEKLSSLDDGIRTIYVTRDDKVRTRQPGRQKLV